MRAGNPSVRHRQCCAFHTAALEPISRHQERTNVDNEFLWTRPQERSWREFLRSEIEAHRFWIDSRKVWIE